MTAQNCFNPIVKNQDSSSVTTQFSFVNDFTFLWWDGSTDNLKNFTSNGTYYVTVTGTNPVCQSVDSVVVTGLNVPPPPPGVILYDVMGGGSLCAGGAGILVSLSGSQIGYLYYLAFNGNFIGNPVTGTGGQILLGPQTQAGMYTVFVLYNGQTTQMSGQAVISSSNIILSTQVTNVSCAGGSNGTVDLSVTGATSPTYLWSTGIITQDVMNLGAGTYTVTVTDANGCTAATTATITAPAAISLSATSTPASCNGNNGTATLFASGGTGNYAYAWSPSCSTQQNPTNLSSGNYVVSVTDANGCTAMTSVVVGQTVNVPFADFTFAVNGKNVNFINLSSNATKYVWVFGDGTTSTDMTPPLYFYSAGGNYSVTLVVTNACGEQVSVTKEIVIAPPAQAPVADFTASQQTICAGQSMTFKDLSLNTPTTWAWIFPGGNPSSSTLQNPTVTYNTPGVYAVTLSVTNAAGTDTENKFGFITVGSNVSVADFSYGINGKTVSFSSLTTGNLYQWNFGDGTTSTEKNPTHSYNGGGSFSVILTVTGGCGSASSTKVINLSCFDLNITASILKPKVDQYVHFTALIPSNPQGSGITWVWTAQNGILQYPYSCCPNIKFTSPGVWEVKVTVNDANGCIVSKSYFVEVVSNTTGDIDTFGKAEEGPSAYPNPTTANFKISSFAGEIEIFDTLGKSAGTKDIKKDEEIDLSSYPVGVYHIRLQTGNDAEYISVIKK